MTSQTTTPPSIPLGVTQHIARVDAQYAQLFIAVGAIAPDAIAHLQFIEPFQFPTIGGASPLQPPPPPPSHDEHTGAYGDDDDEDIANIGS